MAAIETAALRRLRVVIHGGVQGVGFRPFIYRLATSMDLRGWVLNSAQGVFIEVEGPEERLREFVTRVEREKPAISFIQSLEATSLDPIGFANFEIRESSDGAKTAIVLPDVATCPDCLREISDRADRRYRYPFTNCTNCGPRFSIIEALPYDRPRTTMSGFIMCPECAREYHDPADRRFHAQPNACPVCGPHLELWKRDGTITAVRDAALLETADAVRRGHIVAVKGLGGFHLICDARNDAAVRELRLRKRREEKPFALMFPSLESVESFCEVSADEERLLRSPASPIVLLRRRKNAPPLSTALAPGNPYLGAMLPYTPLHQLLLVELGFPVVATSGNLSEEPICTDERDALKRLHNIADVFLVHNRPIARHVDDSVARIVAGRELVLRRARGFAPLPVSVKGDLPQIIAVGAHQKNAIAASVGQQVFVSQHIGDLETAASLHAFERVVAAFRQMYELAPERIACDMHPAYMSTQYARRQNGITFPVQHHYAHVLSCMAENELEPPVLGISWDGSGFGLDGTVWGGEFLHVTAGGMRRAAHFRTFRLPGNEQAVREPRRAALSVLYETFGDETWTLNLPTVTAFTAAELRVLRSMLECGLNAPVTSSAGRLFDAVASIAGIRQVCRHEGQAAMELEFAIDEGRMNAGAAGVANPSPVQPACSVATRVTNPSPYPFEISALVFDWRPMIREIVREGGSPSQISMRFHNTLVAAGVEIARRVGEQKVVLSGGCFQNKYLTERFIAELLAAGFTPYWHQRVPPNDGGIALGQIMAATSRNPGGQHVSGSAR